ncbi:sulfotransferase 1C4 [Octopus bimaculoides]|uniref:Sulfotransferase domain-containing protein n=1 Tax=Octopus bimaculoides TaxID=37653 RepID=A0A0L8I519_OCTBM|nr:sulfotransferase 1C4 [Octopus bimaculoides]|eukprot:XP_014790786.1 PREDICTED: sulfotransferase 1C4-like [Octopus bimaculoides]
MSSTSTVSEVKMRDCEEIKKEIESNAVQFIGNDGEPMLIYQYKGHNFLRIEMASSALSKLHTVKIRPDDILLYTHPGAGSHWMFEVINMVLRESSERISTIKESLLLDWAPIEILESAESPRVLNTHLSIEFLPPELLKDHKIIYLNRNPKAMVVSYYRHVSSSKATEYTGDFPSFFDLYMKGKVPYDDYFKHVQEFYALIKDNPNALIITYEEMQKDLYKVVLHIAKFLDKTISDQLAKSIVDMCSFDKMKSEKTLVSASCVPKDLFKEGGTFYHSGKVDTWKKWLTVEQSERIDAKIQSEFIDKGIIFNF